MKMRQISVARLKPEKRQQPKKNRKVEKNSSGTDCVQPRPSFHWRIDGRYKWYP